MDIFRITATCRKTASRYAAKIPARAILVILTMSGCSSSAVSYIDPFEQPDRIPRQIEARDWDLYRGYGRGQDSEEAAFEEALAHAERQARQDIRIITSYCSQIEDSWSCLVVGGVKTNKRNDSLPNLAEVLANSSQFQAPRLGAKKSSAHAAGVTVSHIIQESCTYRTCMDIFTQRYKNGKLARRGCAKWKIASAKIYRELANLTAEYYGGDPFFWTDEQITTNSLPNHHTAFNVETGEIYVKQMDETHNVIFYCQ